MRACIVGGRSTNFSVEVALRAESGCLLIEPGWRCCPDLPLWTEQAGLHAIPGEIAVATKGRWAAAFLAVASEFATEAREALESLSSGCGIPVILILPDPDSVDIAELLHAGACDFITPPFSGSTVIPRIRRLAPDRKAVTAASRLPSELGLLGQSPAFIAEMEKLTAISSCDVTVLIAGETGTGKELVARAIHTMSSRQGHSFVPVDCGAIPQELAESEFFGHERGAFTGAVTKTAGLVGAANGGTLFLDEVDGLSLATQAKLLRFLQQREYRAVGSTAMQRSDVRVISATNADLSERVIEGKFREDLFYRLKVVQVQLPPLRERGEDVALLAEHFVKKVADRFGRAVPGISPSAMTRLLAHRWPGNIREVENVMEAAVALSSGAWLQAGDLSFGHGVPMSAGSLREAKARAVQDFERTFIVRLLRTYEGNISEAARAAKKNRRAFFELMRKYKVRAEEYRDARKGPGREPGGSAMAASG